MPTRWRGSGAVADRRHHHGHHRQQRAAAEAMAEKPSTACRNCVSTRKMPNITANTMSSVSEPAARPRLANSRISSSGCLGAAPRRRRRARRRSRGSGCRARSGRSSPARGPRGCRGRGRRWPIADRMEPTVSKRPVVRLAGVADRRAATSRARAPANSTGIANSRGHVKLSISERRHEQAEDAAGAGEAGPDADGPGPLLGGEARRDHRQRDRHDHRRRHAGEDASDQQHLDRRRRNPASVLAPTNEDEPGDEDRLAAAAVAERRRSAAAARRAPSCSR